MTISYFHRSQPEIGPFLIAPCKMTCEKSTTFPNSSKARAYIRLILFETVSVYRIPLKQEQCINWGLGGLKSWQFIDRSNLNNPLGALKCIPCPFCTLYQFKVTAFLFSAIFTIHTSNKVGETIAQYKALSKVVYSKVWNLVNIYLWRFITFSLCIRFYTKNHRLNWT